MSIRCGHFSGLVILIAVAAMLACWTDSSPCPECLSFGPQTMDEVIALTQSLGLHYRSDRQDGRVVSRLKEFWT
jgi:hypothetical protein